MTTLLCKTPDELCAELGATINTARNPFKFDLNTNKLIHVMFIL